MPQMKKLDQFLEEVMVKNGEICQFLNQIHHKMFNVFHHFSPFFTISKLNLFTVPELWLNCEKW